MKLWGKKKEGEKKNLKHIKNAIERSKNVHAETNPERIQTAFFWCDLKM